MSKSLANKSAPSTAIETVLERPKFLTGQARGSENVTMQDIVVPRIEVVQPLSKCLDRNDPTYITGIEPGFLYNSVTREVYGETVTIVPVVFRKAFLLFRKRAAGGGFRGGYQTQAEADSHRQTLEDPANIEVIEAAEHLVLVQSGGGLQEAMLTCTKTKLKISRQLNSFVQLRGEDRWATAYELGSRQEKNDKGTFWNYAVRPLGYVPEEVYNRGAKLWKAVSSQGQGYVADAHDLDDEAMSTAEM